MRYLIVPADVHLVDRKSGKALLLQRHANEQAQPWILSHEDFLSEYVFSHPNMTRGGAAALRRIQKLERAFRGCQPNSLIAVEDSDYLLVRDMVERIEWPTQLARFAPQMLPHLEAWERADAQNDAWLEAAKEAGAVTVSSPPPAPAEASEAPSEQPAAAAV